MTADKPRADLVALLLQFEACAASLSSMHLTGQDATRAVAAWVEMRGHRVEPEQLTRRDLDGREIAWTMWTVTPTGGPDWSVTCSLPDHEVTAQADPQVLARVQAALDGEQPDPEGPAALVGHRRSPADVAATVIGWSLDEQPEAPACPECDGPADHCADCGAPNGRPHEAFCHQQPEAAEGSV